MKPEAHSLWGGRFDDGLAPEMEALNRSLDVDWRLWPHDIRCSRAWAKGLRRAGILTRDEADRIDAGLASVARDLGANGREHAGDGPGAADASGSGDGACAGDASGTAAAPRPATFADEDIHTLVERLLTERIGPVGGKLHTGRSRNDQVATDFRLWGLDAIRRLRLLTSELIGALADRARSGELRDAVMPGFTHLQPAQPVPVAHWLLSRAWPLVRDLEQLRAVERECDALPLGAGAIAGCPLPIDRERMAADLGFARVTENSMDAVADRDWAARLVFGAAMIGVHVSQLAEDLVLFSTAEFGFVRLGDAFTTGSSLMPQKRNPDVAELARGKAGRLVGGATAMLTLLKGLPTGYNRDLQEDKEAVFDAVDTLALVLPAMTGAVRSMTVNRERMRAAVGPAMLATDLADHLVRRGVPFRESHHAVGALVRLAETTGRELPDLGLDEMRAVRPEFGDDVHEVFDARASVESRAVRGGTAAAAVAAQLEELDARLRAVEARRDGLEASI